MNIDYAYLIFGYFFAEQFGDCAIMNTGQFILAPSRPGQLQACKHTWERRAASLKWIFLILEYSWFDERAKLQDLLVYVFRGFLHLVAALPVNPSLTVRSMPSPLCA